MLSPRMYPRKTLGPLAAAFVAVAALLGTPLPVFGPQTPMVIAAAVSAALMLGADGALVGSRLWASREANVSERMHQAALF